MTLKVLECFGREWTSVWCSCCDLSCQIGSCLFISKVFSHGSLSLNGKGLIVKMAFGGPVYREVIARAIAADTTGKCDDICPTCKRQSTGKVIQCNDCRKWSHLSCVNLGSLNKSDFENLEWSCSHCWKDYRAKIIELDQIISDLRDDLDKERQESVKCQKECAESLKDSARDIATVANKIHSLLDNRSTRGGEGSFPVSQGGASGGGVPTYAGIVKEKHTLSVKSTDQNIKMSEKKVKFKVP